MKIEILLFNDCNSLIKSLILPDGITADLCLENGINSLKFCVDGEDEKSAEMLSNSFDEIKKKFANCRYFISVNEPSAYFNKNLYPAFNTFERNLRKLIFIVAIKSGNENILRIAEKVEFLELGDLDNDLIRSKVGVKAYKNSIQNNPNAGWYKNHIDNIIKEKTLWQFLIEEDSFI
jgi:hypothetical protein